MSVLQTFTKLDPLKSINARIDPLMNMMGAYGTNAPTPFDPIFTKMGAYGYKQAPESTATTLQSLSPPTSDTSTSVATSTQQQAAAAAAQTSTQKASTSGTLFGS
jgi:hypothetical protein